MIRAWTIAAGLALAAGPSGLDAQTARPVPYPVEESPGFTAAVRSGTRTATGAPGPRYWQQAAAYTLSATLDPASARLSAQGTVRYENRSPDTLTVVWFHLHQNLFAPGMPRNRTVPLTGGMTLTRVAAQGRDLTPVEDSRTPGWTVSLTRLRIRLPEPLLPGGTAEFAFAWSFTVTPDGAPRGGQDGETFFLSYWYPQVAVYDDLSGWQVDPYLGNAEFYMGYADYQVDLTVPAGWLIAATGSLVNPGEVLRPDAAERLRQAAASSTVVPIVSEAELSAGHATAESADGRLTWRFQATGVRDFAFGASNRYLWDATGARTGNEGRTLIQTFYRPSRRAWAWGESARYARHSIEFLSGYLWSYPYPHATAVDGVTSCGGMEFPMLTCIGGPRDTLSLYSVIVHELAHMWFPMQVGSDEKRYSWQDEGFTRFNQAQGMRDIFRGYDREALARENYLEFSRTGGEVALMRHGDEYPIGSAAFGVASYDKMATNLVSLRSLIGDASFRESLRTYGREWLGRHPAPWDFFNTVERVTRRQLDWFWRSWWYETWNLDQAVAGVRPAPDSVTIAIEDRGLAPMPVRLAVRRTGGAVERYEIPVEVWFDGSRRFEVRVPALPAIASVEIDPEHAFPDINRANNVWSGLR